MVSAFFPQPLEVIAVSLQGFVELLPVRALPGVGRKMEKTLRSMGISSVSELRQKCTRKDLIGVLGTRSGMTLAREHISKAILSCTIYRLHVATQL